MKKIVVSRFGGPVVLEFHEVDNPAPEADEVIYWRGAIDGIMCAGELKEVILRPPFTPAKTSDV